MQRKRGSHVKLYSFDYNNSNKLLSITQFWVSERLRRGSRIKDFRARVWQRKLWRSLRWGSETNKKVSVKKKFHNQVDLSSIFHQIVVMVVGRPIEDVFELYFVIALTYSNSMVKSSYIVCLTCFYRLKRNSSHLTMTTIVWLTFKFPGYYFSLNTCMELMCIKR